MNLCEAETLLVFTLAHRGSPGRAVRVFDRRSRERIPSQEGIDDPEVATVFEWVTRMPQMRWIRHFVITHAARLKNHGEAADLGSVLLLLLIRNHPHPPFIAVSGWLIIDKDSGDGPS